MSDIMTKMEGGKSVESNQASVISDQPARAKRASPMRMPAIDVRELSDEMLIFLLQLMAPEKYGNRNTSGTQPPSSAVALLRRVDSTQCASGGEDAERIGESNQSSVISNQSAAGESVAAAAGSVGVRSEMRSQGETTSQLKNPELPESGCDFVPQTAGDKWVIRQDCPEIERGKAAFGSPATSVTRPGIQSASGGENAEARAIKIMSKIKIKIERDFGNEVRVQEQSEEEAPPFGEDAEMVRPGDAERMGESKQPSVISDHFAVAEDRKVRSETPGSSSELPESRRDFVSQTAGGESVMREDSPEIERGKAQGSRLNAKVRNNEDCTVSACGGKAALSTPSACVEEDTEASAIKIMSKDTLDLNLTQPGPVTSKPPLGAPIETPEMPESGLASSAEVAHGEKVTSVEKPICLPLARRNEGGANRNRRGREPAAMDAGHALTGLGDGWGRLIPHRRDCARRTRFSPGFHMWGLQGSALHPPRHRRGGGKTPESWCDFIWQDAGGEWVMRHECPEIRRGKAESGMLKIEIGAPQAEMAESGSDFILHDADGESFMRRKCPEILRGGGDRGGGVKAVEGSRSPSPGGTTEGLGADEHPWGLRRGVNEVEGDRVGMAETPESGCDFVPQDVGGELVMRQDCPEFPRGNVVESIERSWNCWLNEIQISRVAEEGSGSSCARRVARARRQKRQRTGALQALAGDVPTRTHHASGCRCPARSWPLGDRWEVAGRCPLGTWRKRGGGLMETLSVVNDGTLPPCVARSLRQNTLAPMKNAA